MKKVVLIILMFFLVKLALPLEGGEALMLRIILKDSLAEQVRTADSSNWEITKATDGRYYIYDLGSPLVLSDQLISFPIVDYIDYYSPLVPWEYWKELAITKKKEKELVYFKKKGEIYFKKPGEKSFCGFVFRTTYQRDRYTLINHQVLFTSSLVERSNYITPLILFIILFLGVAGMVKFLLVKDRKKLINLIIVVVLIFPAFLSMVAGFNSLALTIPSVLLGTGAALLFFWLWKKYKKRVKRNL